MRFELSRKNNPAQIAKRMALQLVSLQAIAVILIASAWGFSSSHAVFSAILGGLAAVIPSFFYALYLFKTVSARETQRIILAFFIGELIKLMLGIIMLVGIIWFLPVKMLPLLTGFLGPHLGLFLAPLVLNRNNRSIA